MAQPIDQPQANPQSAAVRAVAAILRPLARLMIDHGVGLGTVVEVLKQSLVDESERRYPIAGRKLSDTRVALLTGVHRKDVRRLRRAVEPAPVQPTVPLTAAVVARWLSDPLFLNLDQTPRVLHRSPKAGTRGQPGFAELVAGVSKDVSARAVLDELVRLGVVEVTEHGQVGLRDTAFVPQGSAAEQLEFLAGGVSDHLEVAAHNVAPQRTGAPLLEQSAFSQGLSAEQAELLHARARQLWSTALQQFLQAATLAEERSRLAKGPLHRVRWGVYFMQEASVQSESADERSP